MSLPPEIEKVALLGWAVYPCSQNSKHGCFKGASAAATCDLAKLEEWSGRFPGCNWRVVFGPSGLWGIDLDVPRDGGHAGDGVTAFADIARAYTALPACPVSLSGGGGLALFFRWQGEPIVGKTGYPADGIDPRRGALSVTIPPSIHIATRRPYVWRTAPWDVSAPTAPDWLLRVFRPPPEPELRRSELPTDIDARAILIRAGGIIRSAPPGAANDTLNRRAYILARWVAAGVLGERDAVEFCYAAAHDRKIPLPEARATIRSAFRKGLLLPMQVAR
jgi:hypothetical protein